MKKVLFLILVIFLASCSQKYTPTSTSRENVYNMYGQKVLYLKLINNELDKGVYYIQVIDDEKAPYWTKSVQIESLK